MAHVLILTLIFPPDNVSTAHLMGELAEDLIEAGHQVTVLTTMPHFNKDVVAEASQPIRPLFGRLLRRSDYGGVAVYHTSVLGRTGGNLKRVVGYLLFHLISTVAGCLIPRRVDVVLSPSPPLTIVVGAWLLGLRHRAPYVYNVQEVYPDLAVSLGVIRNRSLVSILYRLERFAYRKAATVTVISHQIRQRLIDKGVQPDKVVYIPNWVDVEAIRVLPKDNAFSREHRVHDRFVVSYAGNMGLAQGFDELFEAASLLHSYGGIQFLLIGDGVERDRLRARIEELQLGNVVMLAYQPYHLVPFIYASSDLSFVPLHSSATAEALPSKVYRIMAAGRAVLAIADTDSDLSELIADSGAGLLVSPGSGSRLADLILEISTDAEKMAAMGQAGRRYVETNYSRRVVVPRYLDLISSLVKQKT